MRLQSQVDFWNVNRTKYPNFESVWAIEALLYPGDVLYLPPYWFHRVITEEPGIGLNVWSSSVAMKVEDIAKKAPIPLSQSWSQPDLILALKLYFLSLITHIITPHPNLFISKMVTLQFLPLFLGLDVPELGCSFSEEEVERFLRVWKGTLDEGVEHLEGIFLVIDDEHIRGLEVFTYLEKLTSIVLGPERVYPFFKGCFLVAQ